MFEKSKAAEDSGAMLSMGYAVEFAGFFESFKCSTNCKFIS
jgi:hypothetical protein